MFGRTFFYRLILKFMWNDKSSKITTIFLEKKKKKKDKIGGITLAGI